MRPTKKGQIAKFHTPLEDENPKQIYIVLEVIEDTDIPRALIKALNTGLSFPPINTVQLDDLEVVEVDTQDLIGHYVTINKSDNSKVQGKIVKVIKQKIMLDLAIVEKGVETNVRLTIVDNLGVEHTGLLFVN
ncbi:MAG: hypothetical protein P1P88_21625 [Bacteroidales bacterium]|nr:hypothetical protein [Bacteroidales bacterium]